MSLPEGTQPSPNSDIPRNLQAVSTLSAYPVATIRKYLSAMEWTTYKEKWATFERIWIYNWGISTINGLNTREKKSPWQFVSNKERQYYIEGQQAHIEYYSNAPISQFNNIPN